MKDIVAQILVGLVHGVIDDNMVKMRWICSVFPIPPSCFKSLLDRLLRLCATPSKSLFEYLQVWGADENISRVEV